MVARPAPPERPAVVTRYAQALVSDSGRRAVVLPGSAVLADRNDRDGIAFEGSGVAAAGIVSAISRHRADWFVLRHLIEQLGQDRTVPVPARRKLHGPDVGRGGVHGDMNLSPLAATLHAVLADLPFRTRQWFACKP